MNWIQTLQGAIDYMEAHLQENISPLDIAEAVGYAPGHLQKGFTIVTGCTFAEYLRCRRLYEAGRRLREDPQASVLDTALAYGYESAESFSRAFRRFHGFAPSQARDQPGIALHPFLPFSIQLTIRGGNFMLKPVIEQKPALPLIGFRYTLPAHSDSYREIPALWAAFSKRFSHLMSQAHPKTAQEEAVMHNQVGSFGVCFDEADTLDYFIGGPYQGGPIPEGMELTELPSGEYAVFEVTGPLPSALQSVNTQIFKEWLPQHPEYRLARNLSVEWYSADENMQKADYRSAIWLPVEKVSQ